MAGLNDNHRRRVLASLEHADGLLQECLHALDPASPALFPRSVPDLSPPERNWIQSYVERIRDEMSRLLERLEIKRSVSRTATSWVLRTNLTALDVVLEDLYPEQMTGYGEIGPEAARDLTWTVQEVRRLVAQLSGFIRESSARELPVATGSAGSPTGLLPRIDEIVARRGLVEFLPALQAIRRKLESHRFEIAVFGRVSSGKSSLINRFLGFDLLPVGATPVTAVPVHIVAGSRSEVRVESAGRPAEVVPLGRLREFATEQHNPGNVKRIVSLEVVAPSPKLKQGVAFVDTPGVASLAGSGTELSLAYLPNCDFGLVLVDGHSSVGREDLELLRSLRAAGVPAVVLVSKCDQLTESDREAVLDYTRKAVAEQVGPAVEIASTSSAESWAERMNRWFERRIAPLVERSQEALAASVERKTASLRDSLLATLEMRSESGSGNSVEQVLRPMDERLLEFRRRWSEFFSGAAGWAGELLEAHASVLAADSGDGPTLADALSMFVSSRSKPFLDEFEQLARDTGELSRRVGANETDLAAPGALPVPDVARLDGIALARPGPLASVSRRTRVGFFRGELEAQAGRQVRELFSELAPRLLRWCETALGRLEAAYHVETDPFRYRLSIRGRHTRAAPDQLRQDIASLREAGRAAVPSS